jgi:hypothetical protein
MNDSLRLCTYVTAEKEQLDAIVDLIKAFIPKKRKSAVELCGLGGLLHNFYSGVENILKQILEYEKINILKSESWHKDVLACSVKRGIIAHAVADKLLLYLSFRHFYVHGYGHMLNEQKLLSLARPLQGVYRNFFKDIRTYTASLLMCEKSMRSKCS